MRNLERPGRSPVHAPNGMAATSHAIASQTAIRILQDGGNALDAAIAACAVQCVVEPESTTIGGDCFCLYAPGDGSNVIGFNGSGRAPMAATVDWYLSRGATKIGRDVHSVSIPGAVDAWFQLNRDHGVLPWADVLAPAIECARDGFAMSSRVYFDHCGELELLRAEPSTAAMYLIDGEVPPVGTRLTQPILAETLSQIAKGGRDAFYTGAIAEDIVSYLQSKGGLHTLEDFATAQGEYVTPISTDFRGMTVWQCPPNGQGVIALLLLNIINGLPVDTDAGPISVDRMHQEIEAGRMAYRARNLYVADPAFSDIPVSELLSDAYATDIRNAIDMTRAQVPPQDIALPNHRDTAYITVVDKDRNACSFINTAYSNFGSGLVSPKTGVMLQNRAAGFTLEEGHPNCIAPGKRPLHTIIPGMVTQNGRTIMSYGVMGGQYQPMGHLQFLTRYFDFGLDIQEAIDLPRFIAEPFSGKVQMESTVPQDIRDALIARGHDVVPARGPLGGAQAIYIDWDQNMLTGGSDPRKDGCAIGY